MNFFIKSGEQIEIICEPRESEAVKIAAGNLKTDIEKAVPETCVKINSNEGESAAIRIGTLGVSEWVKDCDTRALCDEKGLLRKEAFQISVKDGALEIVGTDRRGTVYGIYTISEKLGVSPWYFFADVPVKPLKEFSLPSDFFFTDFPSVEYRGIFINDEEELEAWVQNFMKEPTIGVKTYEKIFELLLRLKANYIWPAMHVNSFNMYPENGALAERMGIVVGTSHCDMLMRSNNREWKPWIERKGYTDAEYDYSIEGRNREILKEYWQESVEQNKDFEVCYTLGMRGIHDSGFETKDLAGKSKEEILKAKVNLLEQIITDQRKILKSELDTPPMTTFIPYKEVLELYDNGLNVPEDITLVWANDNYGYIRRFPSEKEQKRSGGNGIYYHNSYWAPPSMSYVFLCSIPLAHTRNELSKAWDEGIRKLWVLNVGAMKPLELEISFFLTLAWEIGKEGALTEDVDKFTEVWCDKIFSGHIGKTVSRMLNDFSGLTNVRKLENMDQDAFSQTAYGDEAALRIHMYEELFNTGNKLYESLPEEEKDSFYQLVLMRIHAGYFTNLSWYYGDRSVLMMERGNAQAAKEYAAKSRISDNARRRMVYYYNHVMSEGKWNGIVNPEGFPPPRAAMMPVSKRPLSIEGKPEISVNIRNDDGKLKFTKPGTKWIDIGVIGKGEIRVKISAPEWVKISEDSFKVSTEKRILVSVPAIEGNLQGQIILTEEDFAAEIKIPVKTLYIEDKQRDAAEEDGIIAIEADSASSKDFKVVKRLGRLKGNLVEAVKKDNKLTDRECDPLKYTFYCISEGDFLLELHRFPSLNSTGRIRIGVSIDDGEIMILESESNDEWRGTWKANVLANVDRLTCKLNGIKAGSHTLKIYAIDPYVSFSRIIIYTLERKKNELAGILGDERLPEDINLEKWSDSFYGEYKLAPRPQFFAVKNPIPDTLKLTDVIINASEFAKGITPEWYLDKGKQEFTEDKEHGDILIDAATAIVNSEHAHCIDKGINAFDYCDSESFGQTGMAMYVRNMGKCSEPENAPGLSYRFKCEGGDYVLWMLCKFNEKADAYYSVSFDGKIIDPTGLYGEGCLWRYESEQIYRFVPITDLKLDKGEHEISIFSLSGGLRVDRLYLGREGKLPPEDLKWAERSED